MQEQVTFDYLERTHRSGESYETRQRRRHAFQAGMQAGAFVLIPRGLSQAAACDGNNYQVTPNEASEMYLPMEFCRFSTQKLLVHLKQLL